MRPAAILIVIALAGVARAQTGSGTGTGTGPIVIDPRDLHGAPEVTAAASPSEIVVGTRFVLIVTAAYEEGVTVNLPARLDLGPAFEELRRTSVDRTRTDGKKVREWQVECLAWELGELQVPPVQVTFVAGGSASAILTNAVPVRVIGSLGDMVDTVPPRAHAPPVTLWKRTWFWVIVAAAVAVAIAAVVAFVIVRRRRRPVTTFTPVRTSSLFRRQRLGGPAEDALARLEAIDTSGMLARDRKVAYTEMIAVMQEFLGRQLGGDVEDLTLGELRAWLADLPEPVLAGARRAELERWLDACELVKFGGYPASIEEGKVSLVAGRDLVIGIALPGAGAPAAPEPAEAAHA